MNKKDLSQEQLGEENERLRGLLEEAEIKIRDMRGGEGEAINIITAENKKTIPLKGGDYPFRAMVESLNEGAIILIPDGTIFFCNPRFAEIVQMTPEKLVGFPLKSLIAPEQHDAFETLLKASRNASVRGEFQLQTSNARHMPVQLSVRQLITEDMQGISIVITDLTESKLAEIALKEKVEDLRRLATVVSDSNDAVIMHDLEGKILAWNRGAKEIYGYTEAEALGMNVRDIVAEGDRDAALTLIQKIKQGEVVKSFELRRVTKDGRILNVWLTTTLLMDEKGEPVAIATTERDITERKRAETDLKEKVEDLRRMATVVSDSNDAVIMHDFEGKILAWNRGAKETYGYTEAEASGKECQGHRC